MDLTKITAIVRSHLTKIPSISSLQLQNHIYGCFILMEDIAQKTVEFTGQYIVGDQYVFDLVSHFSQIGVRYGFIMDMTAVVQVSEEYKNIWLELFNDIRLTHDIDLVDRIEDALNDIIQECIPADHAFFIQASATGSLPQNWIVRALSILHPDLITVETKLPQSSQNNTTTHLSNAKTETAIHPSVTNMHRRFFRTRRNVSSLPTTSLLKKGFARTRRNHNIHSH